MLAEGASFSTIKQRLGTTAPTIIRWKRRFATEGLDGLDTSHPGQPALSVDPSWKPVLSASAGRNQRMVQLTGFALDSPLSWVSSKELPLSRLEGSGREAASARRYMANVVQFQAEATDIIGLYLNPP